MQIIHISGSGKNVGKTLLGEKLVSLLASRGFDVCAVKHTHHGVDFKVKDTGRYMSAGARVVAAIGPDELMVVIRGPFKLPDVLCALIGSCRVVVVEGFREDRSHIAEIGGCTAYVERSGRVLLAAKAAGVWQVGVEEAAAKLAELIAGGECRAELEALCKSVRALILPVWEGFARGGIASP